MEITTDRTFVPPVYINSEYDVDKLCGAEFLERMAELRDREGDRLTY